MTDLSPPICDASTWFGPDLANESDWIDELSAAELAEIEAASRSLTEKDIDWTRFEAADFPLPTLQPRLQRIQNEILEGRGFALLRSLPIESWGRRFSAIAF